MGRELSIEERAAKARYPLGKEVRFFDDGAAVEPGRVVATRGTVNGDPIVDPTTGTVWIPLWCEREGREATNVYVNEENIAAD